MQTTFEEKKREKDRTYSSNSNPLNIYQKKKLVFGLKHILIYDFKHRTKESHKKDKQNI